MRNYFIDYLKRTKAILKSSVTTTILILALLFSSPAKALLFDIPAGGVSANNSSSNASLSTTQKVLIGASGVVLAGIIGALLFSGNSDSKPKITPSLKTIQVSPIDPQAVHGFSQQFTAIGIFSDDSEKDITSSVTWTSSKTAVATISNAAESKGLATTIKVGTTNITATLSGITGKQKLTVTNATLVSIEVDPVDPTIASKTTQQFTATGIFSDGTDQDLTNSVTWTSSNTAVATISNTKGSQGLATAEARTTQGTTNITAQYLGMTSEAQILTVTAATVVSIEVDPVDPTIASKTTQQFTATGIFSDGTDQDLTKQVTWMSSDEAVADISNANDNTKGLATAEARTTQGTTNITAQYLGMTSEAQILTVTAATVVSIKIDPANTTIASKTKQQFTATGIFSDGINQDLTNSVTWMSSDEAVADISSAAGSKGLATAKARTTQGTTNITAQYSSVISETQILTVTAATLESIAVTPVNPSTPKRFTEKFTAIGTFSDGTSQDLTNSVTWMSSDEAVADISNAAGSKGLATTKAAGITHITAELSGKTSPPQALTVVIGVVSGDSTGKVYVSGKFLSGTGSGGSLDGGSISSVGVDNQGNIYAGTNHFTGSSAFASNIWQRNIPLNILWKNYSTYASPALSSNEVVLTVDTSGNVYYGNTNGEVIKRTPANLSPSFLGQPNNDKSVTAILATGTPVKLYAGTTGSNIYLWGGGATWNQVGSSLNDGAVNALVVDTAGKFYAGTAGGHVFQLISGAWVKLPDIAFVNTVKAMAADMAGNLYVGGDSSGNISKWDGLAWTPLNKPLVNKAILTLATDLSKQPNVLYAGSGNTTYKYNLSTQNWDSYFSVGSDAIIKSIAVVP